MTATFKDVVLAVHRECGMVTAMAVGAAILQAVKLQDATFATEYGTMVAEEIKRIVATHRT